MKYHCGTLDDEPWNNRVWRWTQREGFWWSLDDVPPDVCHEAVTFFATPGIDNAWFAENLRLNLTVIDKIHAIVKPMVDPQSVSENWLSITPEDGVRFSLRRRWGVGPNLIAQLAIKDHVKAGYGHNELRKMFRVQVYDVAQPHLRMPTSRIRNLPAEWQAMNGLVHPTKYLP